MISPNVFVYLEKFFNMENTELTTDVLYFQHKRDDELERFNDLIKANESVEKIEKCFNSLLRKQKQLKLAEDALIIYRLTQGKKQLKMFGFL